MPDDASDHKVGLTFADFANCGWEEALSGTSREGYTATFQALSTAARQAEIEERDAHGRVLRLLAFACAIHLDPTSRNKPFKPIEVGLDGKQAIIPKGFTEAHMAFFARIVDSIDNPLLKARLADLLWMRKSTRHAKFALTAINSYRSIPLDPETWAFETLECVQRAITLARWIRGAARGQLEEIEASLLDAIDSGTAEDGFFTIKLTDVLASCELPEDQCAFVATKLEDLALVFEEQGDIYKERQYSHAAATWSRKAGNHAKSITMTITEAETWVKEAIARIQSDDQSYLVAVDCYETAVKIYQTIPRVDRDQHQVDQRIAELQRHHTECREKSQGQLRSFATASQDLADIAKNARSAVSNKPPAEAMKAFAGLFTISADQLHELAIESLTKSPIQAFIPTFYLDPDNRVIARHSGLSGPIPSKADAAVIRAEMARHYDWMTSSSVYGRILPALDTLTSEHIAGKEDFVELARLSPTVPPRREVQFGKALFYGYEHEFDTALQLLVPQIENMVRFHLKRRGAKTTNVDEDGIETENGLSTLIDLPQATIVFGKDVAYEIKTLFCDHFGQNLRNNVAHGLLDDDQSQSAHSVYAWWFGLKLVFNTYWSASNRTAETTEEEPNAVDPETP